MSDKVWKGTWKPDGTGGWHTKSDKDIVDQYNSARLTPAPAQMLKDAIDEVVRLRAGYNAMEKMLRENQQHFMRADMERTKLRIENEKLRAAFRVNMLRAFPNMSHDEIDAEIAAAIRESGDD